jgi:SNF2 family DNA or RNA helicase
VKTHGEIRLIGANADRGMYVAKSKHPVWAVKATPDVMIKIKRLFPRGASRRSGEIELTDTPEVARDLEWVLERWPMTMSDGDREALISGADKHREKETTVMEILSGARPHLEFMEPARKARDYQLVAADLVLSTGSLLLADDLGLGKSMSAVLVLRNPDALPALVVCPTHLPRQWRNELAITLPWLKTHLITEMKPYDPATKRDMRGFDPDVLIIPYSKLRGWGHHLAGKMNTVIFDEAQDLRRAQSDKYTAAGQIADGAAFRMGLTATPVYNYGGEMHNIMEIIAPGHLGSREEFAREWGIGSWHDKVSVKDPAALGVYLREAGLMLRRTRSEVGRELPEVVSMVHTVDTDLDMLNELSEDAMSLAQIIVERTAERSEIWRASGELDWKLRHAIGVAKAPYVAEFTKLLLESDEKVVLFGWHRDVYDIWAKKLADYKPVFYTGSESPNQKEWAREAFIEGRSRLLIMSLRSGSGLDGLQDTCRVAVFGELDWSPGVHDQCIGRLHRDGQAESVLVYWPVAEHGSDPVIADVLNLKRMQSEPMRDPDRPLFETMDTADRIRALAEDLLRNAALRLTNASS